MIKIIEVIQNIKSIKNIMYAKGGPLFPMVRALHSTFGRGVCLSAGWVRCHGLMNISTKEEAVHSVSISV